MSTCDKLVAGARSDPSPEACILFAAAGETPAIVIVPFVPVKPFVVPAPTVEESAPAESRDPMSCVPVYSTKYITSSPFGEGGRAPRCKFCGNTKQFDPVSKFCSYCGKDEYTESGGTPACDPSGACASPACVSQPQSTPAATSN